MRASDIAPEKRGREEKAGRAGKMEKGQQSTVVFTETKVGRKLARWPAMRIKVPKKQSKRTPQSKKCLKCALGHDKRGPGRGASDA